jgi:DinB family protein
MGLPPVVESLWRDLEAVRAQVLQEAEGLSQAQSEWRPDETAWSVGEIVHHLTLAEIATGKLTSKLLKEAGPAVAPFPADLARFAALPPWPAETAAEAPPVVRPEKGQAFAQLLADMKAARVRSRQSVERLAAVDPRPHKFRHFAFGELDLAQWWMLQARHDADHLAQLRRVKAAPGFPRA